MALLIVDLDKHIGNARAGPSRPQGASANALSSFRAVPKVPS